MFNDFCRFFHYRPTNPLRTLCTHCLEGGVAREAVAYAVPPSLLARLEVWVVGVDVLVDLVERHRPALRSQGLCDQLR